jgi:hypothetical protein
VAQALMNLAACLGAMTSPLVIGAFTKADIENGWKNFYVSLKKYFKVNGVSH